MNIIDILKDDKYNSEDIISIRIRQRKIKALKEKINEKIKIIEDTGINMDESKEKLIEMNNAYLENYNEHNNISTLTYFYMNELDKFNQDLYYMYNDFISMFKRFQNLKLNSYKTFNIQTLQKGVDEIILNLNRLKEAKEFQDEKYTKFIYNLYQISYEFMQEELIINNKSKLFDYFTSNEHDFWYINEFIKTSIEDIESSINYIFNYDKLKLALENKENSNHYMYKNIIKEIAICENSDYYKEVCEKKFDNFYDRFNSIHFDLMHPSLGYGSMFKRSPSKKQINKIKQNLKKLKQEYEEFIIDKDFLNEYNDIEIQNIKIINLRIQKLLKEMR